jgi:X-Pro dipeptidyl-peptidase
MIFSSDPEFTLHPKPGTILTVDIKSTSLKIPVVGGRKSFYRATK